MQTGQLKFPLREKRLYQGKEDGAPQHAGNALMIALEAQQAYIGLQLVNSHITTVKFITKKNVKPNIMECYATPKNTEKNRQS